jgi:hypothetical protein
MASVSRNEFNQGKWIHLDEKVRLYRVYMGLIKAIKPWPIRLHYKIEDCEWITVEWSEDGREPYQQQMDAVDDAIRAVFGPDWCTSGIIDEGLSRMLDETVVTKYIDHKWACGLVRGLRVACDTV